MSNKLKLLIILLGFAAPIFAQDVSVTAKIDSVQLMLGDQTDLVLQVRLGAKQKANFPVFNDTIIAGIEVLDTSAIDSVFSADGSKLTLTQRFKITSFEEKLHLIPPVAVEVDGETYLSMPLSLKVESFDLSEAKDDEFFGPKDIQVPPFVWSDWNQLFVSLALLVPLIFLIVYLTIRLLDNKPIIRRITLTPETPPHDEALAFIEQIKLDKSNRVSDPKAYYTALTDVIRKYIQRRFNFNALEMTSSEIIDALMSSANQKDIDDLKKLFQTADLVKFAKHNPLINENDANLVNAVEFINETKVLPDSDAKPEPTEKIIVEKRPLQIKIALGVAVALSLAAAITCLVYVIKEGFELIQQLF